MALLVNDPIMFMKSILLLRHIKEQNLSPGDDFIHSMGVMFLFEFWATREAVVSPAIYSIMLGRLL